MNYALDALWWKLTDSDVRNLAALLTAPPLWRSGCELPVRTLLGGHGFRYLLALDQNPQPLAAYLAERAPFGHRLGLYAEALLAFWFAHAPHAKLLAHNLPVLSENGQTLGAADFIAELNGTAYHIELACKYYGGSETAALCGFDTRDTLQGKAAKTMRQLNLLHTPQGMAALKQHRLPTRLESVSLIRGMVFLPEQAAAETPLHPLCWRGRYTHDLQSCCSAQADTRYTLLPRMNYPAPARVAEADTLDSRAASRIESGLIAAVELRPDGFWHETARIMKAV